MNSRPPMLWGLVLVLQLCCWLAAPCSAQAGNPIVPSIGLADPHITIYGDRAYLYGTHDFSPANPKFVTKDWWVWSSSDLVNWTQAGTLRPEDTFLHQPSTQCWAGFGASRNGKYYWYFSAGPKQIGVVVADSPAGPWHDPLGKPLIPAGLTPTEARDPDVLMDADGQAYLVYGTFHYFIVRLNPDMISLAEAPRPVKLDREFGPYGEGKTDDKPSLHQRNGIYYLSWCSFYAMAKNVYGPYAYQGSVIDPTNVAAGFQVDPAVRKYDVWHDRHGNFFTWHHQWYYACNDKSLPGRHTYFRESCLSYVHYRDNGQMAPIRLDAIGVGQYDAAQRRIEAEDYFAAEQAEIRECPRGGFEVRGLGAGSQLIYPHILHWPAAPSIRFSLASGQITGGTLEVHENDPAGRLLGQVALPATGGWDQYQTVACPLSAPPGPGGICLTFRGPPGELARLDWFQIGPSEP